MDADVTPSWAWTGPKSPVRHRLSPSGIWVGIHRLLQSVWTGRVGAPTLPQIPSSWMRVQSLLQTPQGVNLITLIRHFFSPLPCLAYICFWSRLGDGGCCQMQICRFPAFANVRVFPVSFKIGDIQSHRSANRAFADGSSAARSSSTPPSMCPACEATRVIKSRLRKHIPGTQPHVEEKPWVVVT